MAEVIGVDPAGPARSYTAHHVVRAAPPGSVVATSHPGTLLALTLEEAHVLAYTLEHRNERQPWWTHAKAGAPEPYCTEAGWNACLRSVRAKLERALS